MKKMKNMLLLSVLFLMLFIIGCSSDSKTNESSSKGNSAEKSNNIPITIAHVGTEDTSIHLKFEKFKEIVEAKSDGRFDVTIYPNSQMGGEREITESTQIGNIQISSPGIGQLSDVAPSLQSFNLPFVFKNSEEAYEVLDGEIGMSLLEDLEDSGFIGLGYAENGWRHLTTKNGPIISPEEVQGLKLRTQEDPLHLAFWKELGLNPTPLSFSEVYTSLSQGVVDGQENPLDLIESMKFHEVNPYITLTGHIYDPEVFIVNKDFFNSLTEDDQQIIKDATKEIIDYQRQLNSDKEDELIQTLKDDGATITELTEEQKNVWVEGVKNIYKEYSEEVGVENLEAIFKAVNNEVGLEAIK